MDKKLSICMIVKNEEKNLRRCLDSLNPIFKKGYTELIIVDTGSSDLTVDIAKEYTEKVYFHEWNGSFSDMRNISISYATGEWIFILDADEELETPDAFLELLDNSLIDRFNTIKIRAKNLLNTKNNKYSYLTQERLFRNDGDFHYEGNIHNQIVCKKPTLISEIWIKHYGYINNDKELMERKFNRTATMLKDELLKNPESIYYHYQLARSYAMHKDYIESLEEIKLAYELIKNQDEKLITQRFYVFGEYANILMILKRYEKAINICKEGLKYSDDYFDLHYYMGYSYLALGEKQKGVERLESYLNLYIKYNENNLDSLKYASIEMYSMDKIAFENTLNRLISIIYENHLIKDNLQNYFSWLDKLQNINLKLKLSIKLLLTEKNYQGLLDLYMGTDDVLRPYLVMYLESLKSDLKVLNRKKIELLFSKVEDSYGLLNQIRNADNKNKLILEFINNHNLMEFPDDLIIEFSLYLIETNYLIRLFKRLDSITIKKIVRILIERKEKMNFFLESLLTDFSFSDFQNNRVFISIVNIVFLMAENSESNINKKDFQEIFNNYITKGLDYVQFIYNTETIRLTNSTLVNVEDRFFALLYLAKVALDKADINSFRKFIIEAIEQYPFLAAYMENYVAKHMKLNQESFREN